MKHQDICCPPQNGYQWYHVNQGRPTWQHTSSPLEMALKSTELQRLQHGLQTSTVISSIIISSTHQMKLCIKWHCWNDFGLYPGNTLQNKIRKVMKSPLYWTIASVQEDIQCLSFWWNVSLFLVAPKFHRHVQFDGGCGITNLNFALSADIAASGRATMNHYINLDRHHPLQYQAHVTGNFRHPSGKRKSWFQDKSKYGVYAQLCSHQLGHPTQPGVKRRRRTWSHRLRT